MLGSLDYCDSRFLDGDYEMECAVARFDAVSCRRKNKLSLIIGQDIL